MTEGLIIGLNLIPYFLNIYFSQTLPSDFLKKPLLIFSLFLLFDNYIMGILIPGIVYILDLNYEYSQPFINYLIYLTLFSSIYTFFFQFAIRYFKKKRFKSIQEFKINDMRVLKNFWILCLICFLLWVILTKGVALYDSRTAYQNLRSGIGLFWGLGYSITSFFFATKLASNNLRIRDLLIIFFIATSYGSKILVLNFLVTFLIAKDFKSLFQKSYLRKIIIKFKFLFLTFAVISSLFIAFYILWKGLFTQGVDGFIVTINNYFANFLHMKQAVEEPGKYFEQVKDNIYFSSFWVYVPRLIYPEKPYVYGLTSVVEYFYPGATGAGHGITYGLHIMYYLNFGFWGLIPNLIVGTSLLKLIFCIYYLSSRPIINNGLSLFLYTSLIFPLGIYYAIPGILLLFFIYYFYQFRFRV